MDLLSIVGAVLPKIDALIDKIKTDKEKKKMENELRYHKADISRVIQKMNEDLPKADLPETKRLRSFVMTKQNELESRHRIPEDIRKDGKKVYSEALNRIDTVRARLLGAA